MDALGTVAPVVAVVASIVGVLAAVDQLTQRARMRRVAEWCKELAENEDDVDRRTALADVRAWATGHALATVMVPARLFLEAAVWCALVPVIFIASADSASSFVVLSLFGFSALWLVIRRAIRLYLERYRIAAEYFEGDRVIAPPRLTILFQMEGGTRAEFVWSAVLASAITAWSVSAALLLRDNADVTGGLIGLSGFFLAGIGAALVRRATPPLLHAGSTRGGTPG